MSDFIDIHKSGRKEKKACQTYPLVLEVVRVDVFQGNAHQVRRDVRKDAGQLFSRLQVGPGPGELHIAQVLIRNTKIIFKTSRIFYDDITMMHSICRAGVDGHTRSQFPVNSVAFVDRTNVILREFSIPKLKCLCQYCPGLD